MAVRNAPWNWNERIANDQGKATPEFLAWLQQQLQVNELIGTAVPESRLINTTGGIQGGGDLTVDRTLSLTDTAVTPNTYGDATHVAQFTVDQKGRLTSAVAVPISASGGDVEILDEGTPLTTAVTSIDFVGAGVTATAVGDAVTVTIPGGGSSGGGILPVVDGAPPTTGQAAWQVFATGTGASQNVTIPDTVLADATILVFSNGIRYETDEYSISGTVLTMTTTASGDSIEIVGLAVSAAPTFIQTPDGGLVYTEIL